MKKYISLALISALVSCGVTEETDVVTIEKVNEPQIPKIISTGNSLADSPFLTLNHENNPVLSWVEGEDENTFFCFSISKDDGKTFSDPIAITPTKGLTPHKETMPKLAFKNDGSIVAVYQRRTPTLKNRFAGAIYYTQSFNDGETWTEPNYLHTDTSQGVGRSFFDITVLPDGEIGAVWLDGRKRQRDGSTLCFAKTSEKSGFGTDIEIGQKTCQCCRTDIFVDNINKVHVAYRDIINDSIRDIVHLSSLDNGTTFTESTRISEDNWVIYGCPHTGPSITNSENGVSFYWFTSGGSDGVYTTNLAENTKDFTERKLINPHARHPQAITIKNGTTVLTWDETFKTEAGFINKIGVTFKAVDGTEHTEYITTEKEDCNHPVLIETSNNKVLLSWTQKTIKDEVSQIYQTLITY
jgi:hypothetical protein